MKIWEASLFIFLSFHAVVFSQKTGLFTSYRGERDRIHDLIHTKLKVDFNFKEKELNGEEWVTLTPHFYETNQVVLDAKAMVIKTVQLENHVLDYDYDGYQLAVQLPRAYKKGEEFVLYIRYIARPEKVRDKGTISINAAKGLYFINPTDQDQEQPTQVWTQGATEASSCWFPTIDAPNQKTSQEIYITVPKKFKTLSNGVLVNQTMSETTRTDLWKMDQKHAPYLFFMGVGEYEIIQDFYKDIPVNYYLEKKYAPLARAIFGLTPEMIGFFEDRLGVPYPWKKYSQIVVRNFVGGAMENTTAVVHGEDAYQTKGQLIDENQHEDIIAHKLFHHWFGNLVTSESWSHLTLSESFATYGQYLWRAHKYGKEDADAHRFENMNAYKAEPDNIDKKLVRFYYQDESDLFDLVSSNKGAAILHMLRNLLGDRAFFAGLQKFLTDYQYNTAEVSHLRLVFEEVTGKDLNWFFNQWFYGSGHPNIQVSYDYNLSEKTVTINLMQTQTDVFKFPITIDIFENGHKIRHHVFVDQKDTSFKFLYKSESPDLIQVNADGVLLADFDENKALDAYIFQLKHAENYEHKRGALLEIAKKQDQKKAFNAISEALNDDFYKIRIIALQEINLINKWAKKDAINRIKRIASDDPKTFVQAAAIETLGKLIDPELRPIFEGALKSASYSVIGKALVSIYYLDKFYAIQKSKELPQEVKNSIATELTRIYIEENDEEELSFIARNVLAGMFLTNDQKVQKIYKDAYDLIAVSNNTKAIKNLVDDFVIKGNQYREYNFDKVAINLLREMIQKQRTANLPNKYRNIELIKKGIALLIQ